LTHKKAITLFFLERSVSNNILHPCQKKSHLVVSHFILNLARLFIKTLSISISPDIFMINIYFLLINLTMVITYRKY
jgi:hypothetical protein